MSLFEYENDSNLIKTLKQNIIKNRLPINANLFLTNKCNFKCLHCYVQSQKNMDDGSLSIIQWKKVLDILKQKGCISITFSGGEVLASDKFFDIYQYATCKNFHVTLITNISLLKPSHVELFKKNKPNNIIITIYGATNETYHKFCGVNGAWDRVSKNILLLKKLGINIQLQTVLNTVNYEELAKMKKFAEEQNLSFMVFRGINCEIDGNARPLQYQISVEQEIESFRIMNDGAYFLQTADGNVKMWELGYKKCFAGIANCYIDCCGNMFLCNHVSEPKYNILDIGFDYAWDKIYELRQTEIEIANDCSRCDNKNFCGKCTPLFKKLEASIGFPFADCSKILSIKDFLKREK